MTFGKTLRSVVRPVFLGLLTLVSSAAVHAATLDQMKQQGLVCEQSTGYLKATGGAADVKAKVDEINGKRKMQYTKIAEENNVHPDQVGKLTAQKLVPRCS